MGFHLFDENEENDYYIGNKRNDFQIGQYNTQFSVLDGVTEELEKVTEQHQWPADISVPYVLAGGTANSPIANDISNNFALNKVKTESQIWKEMQERYQYENLEDNMKMNLGTLLKGDAQIGVWLFAGLDALFQTYGPSGKWSVIASGVNALVPGQAMVVGRSQAYLRDLREYDKLLQQGFTKEAAQKNLQIDLSMTEVENIGKDTNLIGDIRKHIDMIREANQMGGEPVLWNMMRQVINGKPVNFDRATKVTLESVKAEDTPYYIDLINNYGMSPDEARKFIYNKIGEPLKGFDDNGQIHYTSAFKPNQINFYAGRRKSDFNFMGLNMTQDLFKPEFEDKNYLLEYSPGKVYAGEIHEPGSRAFDLMSGTIDASYQLLPELLAGKGIKGVRNLRKGFRQVNPALETAQTLGRNKKTGKLASINPVAIRKAIRDAADGEIDPFTGKGDFSKITNPKTGKFKELDDITPTYKDIRKAVKREKKNHTFFGAVPRFFSLTKKQILDQPVMDDFFRAVDDTTIDDLDVIATNPILGKLPGPVQKNLAEGTDGNAREVFSAMMDTGLEISENANMRMYRLSEDFVDGMLPVKGSFVLNKMLQQTARKGTQLQQKGGIYGKTVGGALSAVGDEQAAYRSIGSYLGEALRPARVAVDEGLGYIPGLRGLSRSRAAKQLTGGPAVVDTMDEAGNVLKAQKILDDIGGPRLEFEKFLGFSSNFNSSYNPYYRKLLGVIPDMGIPLNNASVGYRQLVSHLQINGYSGAEMSQRLNKFLEIDFANKNAVRDFAKEQADIDVALVFKRGGEKGWEYVQQHAGKMFEGLEKQKIYGAGRNNKNLPNVGDGYEMYNMKNPVTGEMVDMPVMTGSMFSEMADNIAPLMDYKLLNRAMSGMFQVYDDAEVLGIFSRNVKNVFDYGKYRYRKLLNTDDVSLVNPFEDGVISVKRLEEDYFNNLANFYTRNVFKPLVLMRLAFFTRVFLEEQARVATAGLDAFYNNPFKTIQWIASHDPNSKIGKVLNALPFKKAKVTDGQELLMSLEAQEAARIMKFTDLIGPGRRQRNKYTEYIAYSKKEVGTKRYAKHMFYELMSLRNDPIAQQVAKHGYGSAELTKWMNSTVGRQARMDLFNAGGTRWQQILKNNDFTDQHLQYLESRIRIKTGGNVAVGKDLIKQPNGKYRYQLQTSNFGDKRIRAAIADGKLETLDGEVLDFYENPFKTVKSFKQKKVTDALEEYYGETRLDGGFVKVPSLTDEADNAPKGLLQATEDILNDAQQAIFDRLMTKPINYLNRSPVFKQYRWMYITDKMKELSPKLQTQFIKEAKGAGIPTSALQELTGMKALHKNGKIDNYNAINAESKAFGLSMVKNLLYDTRQKHAVSDKLLNVFPFAEVWFEVFQTWGQLLAANPTVLRKAHVSLRGGGAADSYGSSSDDGFIVPDPRNPEEDMFVMPFGGWMTNVIYGEDSETTISPRGYLAGVNLLGQGFVPGPNPVVGFAVNRLLPENTSNPYINDISNYIKDSLFGDFGPPEDVSDVIAVTPVYKKLLAALASNDSFDTINENSKDIHKMRASATIDVFRYGMASGQNNKLYKDGKLSSYLNKLYPNQWTPETITQRQIDNAFLEYSKNASRNLFAMEFLYQFIGPTGFKPEFFMKDDVGNLWGTAVLYEEFVRIREKHEGNDIDTYNEFFELYGIEHPYILSPKTQSEVGKQPTSVRVKQYQAENKEIFDQLDLSGYYLNTDNPNEEKDWNDIVREKSLLSPDQYRRAVNDTIGFFRYKTFTTNLEKLDIDYKKKTQVKRIFREGLKEALPGFQADEYGLLTPVRTADVFSEMRRKWRNIPGVMETEAGKGFGEIMPFWEEMEKLSQEYSPTATKDWWLKSDDTRALSMRIWMYNKAQQIIADNPEFWSVWNGVMLKLYRDDFEVLDYIDGE